MPPSRRKWSSQVTIKRVERNKHKFVTAIHGLEVFDIESKKFLAQQFATGASVAKSAQGQDGITVQGDLTDGVLELIENKTGVFKGVPANDAEVVEDKKAAE